MRPREQGAGVARKGLARASRAQRAPLLARWARAGGDALRALAPTIGARPRVALFLVLFLPFTVFARFVGRFHPFNKMTMFATPVTEASHVTVRMESGELRDVNWFERWACDGPISFDENGQRSGSHEIHHNYLLANLGTPVVGLPVDIIIRTYRIPSHGAPVETADRLIVRCRADLKDHPTLW